jgi:hypothetical protein
MDLNNSQVHRGQIVKNAVVKSGIKIAQLGRKLSKSRRFFYLMFENELMPINYVKEIGEAISYDFSKEIPELKNVAETNKIDEYWKDKYISLLEEHNTLLKIHYGKH